MLVDSLSGFGMIFALIDLRCGAISKLSESFFDMCDSFVQYGVPRHFGGFSGLISWMYYLPRVLRVMVYF